MGCYKFLYEEDVPWLIEKGSLQFGRLRYYQLLEVATSRLGIGDRLEGAAITPVENLPINDATPAPIIEYLGQSGMVLGPEVNMKLSGIFETDIDCYVMSLSVGTFDEMVAALCTERSPNEAYNACVEVLDLKDLCALIARKGLVNGEPISKYFTVHLCEVKYNQKLTHVLQCDGIIPVGSPCLKRLEFGYQREWRVILFFKEDWKEDWKDKPSHIQVVIPEPATLLRELSVPPVEVIKTEKIGPNVAVRAIRSILKKTQRTIEQKFPRPEGLKRRAWFDAMVEREHLIQEYFKPIRSKLCALYMQLREVKSWSRLEDSFLDDATFTYINWEMEEYLKMIKKCR